MRIAHVTPYFLPSYGGVEIHILKLAQQQIGVGHEATVFTLESAHGQPLGWKEWEGVRLFRGKNVASSLRRAFGSSPDVIHAHGARSPFAAASLLIARFARVPSVFTPYCYYPPTTRVAYVKKLIYDATVGRLALRLSHGVLSGTVVDRAASIRSGADPHRCHLVPNAVDLERLVGAVPDYTWLQEAGLTDFVLYVGRINRVKNVGFLVEALPQLPPSVKLLAVGPVEDNQCVSDMQVRAHELGVADRVIFAGKVNFEELVAAYKRARVFVFASDFEGLPTAVLEAMALGKIVVAAATGGTPTLIQHGVNGFLFRPGDLGAFGTTVNTCLSKEMTRVCEAAARTVAHGYSWRSVSSTVEEIYRQVGACAGPPRGHLPSTSMPREEFA